MIRSTGDRMCTYGLVESLSLSGENNKCSREYLANTTGLSRDILRQAEGDHLDQVNLYQMVLEGRLVLVIRGQESQN
jgi:hypothetical protein